MALKISQAESLGLSNLGILLMVLIIAVTGYLCAQLFPMFYGYYDLEAQFESMAEKAGEKSDREIRDYLVDQINSNHIEIEKSDLKITRRNRTMTIELDYSQSLTFKIPPDREWEIHEFDFHVFAEDEF